MKLKEIKPVFQLIRQAHSFDLFLKLKFDTKIFRTHKNVCDYCNVT